MDTKSQTIKSIIDRIFGSPDKASGEFLYFCPKCKHYKRKLSISFEKGVFKCWVCDNFSGKDLGYLIRKYGSYEDVKEYSCTLETISSDAIKKLFFKEEERKKINLTCELPIEYKFIFYGKSQIYYKAFEYLKKRGISTDDIYQWKIGVCEYGDYKGRIIVPSFNDKGYINFFVAQSIDDNPKYKWLYPKVPKSHIIFNELNIDWTLPVYITEGITDAIKISNNVIPLNGKTIAIDDFNYSKLIEKLIIYQTPVYLCLDTDNENGKLINRSLKVAEILMNHSIHNIYILDPAPYKDFGGIPKNEINKFLTNQTKIESDFDILRKKLEMELNGCSY